MPARPADAPSVPGRDRSTRTERTRTPWFAPAAVATFLAAGATLAAGCTDAPDRPDETADAPATHAAADDRPANPLGVDPVPETTTDRSAETPGATDPTPEAGPESAAEDATGDGGADPEDERVTTRRPPPSDAATAAVPELPPLSESQSAALASAETALAEGRAADAARIAKGAEKEHGDHPLLRVMGARAHLMLAEEAFAGGGDGFLVKGHIADAHLRVDQAREAAGAAAGRLPGAAALLARVLRFEENPDAARELLRTHIAEHPDDLAARLEAADMAETARDWETADTHLTNAVRLAPEDGTLWLRSTIAKQWTQAYPVAKLRAGYLNAARLLPDATRPVDLLIKLYGTPEQRLAAADAVIEQNPDATWARVWKSYVYRAPPYEDLGKALAVLDEARAIKPNDTAVGFQRAKVLEALNRPMEALASYVVAVENGEAGKVWEASNTLDAMLHVSDIARTVDLPTRERAYAALCEKNPGVGRFGNNAGLWFRDVVKDYEKSLHWYLKSVEAEPDDQDFLNDTALIYLFHLRDRKDECLPMFEHVLERVHDVGDPPQRGYWDTLENLCMYWFELGQYERVVEYAKLRANPDVVVNGRPYPSLKAAQWGARARKKLAK